jgi:uncharacterized protein YkwD
MVGFPLAAAAVVAAALPHTTAVTAHPCHSSTKHGQVACLVNRERLARGLPALVGGGRLHASARIEAGRIAHCSFSHFPCGVPWTDSMRDFARSCRSWAAGEVLARGFRTPAAVVAAWMASPGHRRILLAPGMHGIGVAHYLGVWVLHTATCSRRRAIPAPFGQPS